LLIAQGIISEIRSYRERFFFRGVKSSAKLMVANNASNLEDLDFVLLLPREESGLQMELPLTVLTGKQSRMALPQPAILLRCLSSDRNFQSLPSQADIARCYKSQHRWGLRERAEEDFSDMSHYPLQNMTKP